MKIRIILEGKKTTEFQEAEGFRAAWKSTFGEMLGEDCSTAQAMIAVWLHMFLWLMSDSDRALMLSILLGKTVEPAEIAPLRKEVRLKAWEDFPDAYSQAPVRIETRP